MADGREGPSTTIERSCAGCRFNVSESYAVQGDSGQSVYCTNGEKRYIGDTTWDTPAWCPVLAARTEAPLDDSPLGFWPDGETLTALLDRWEERAEGCDAESASVHAEIEAATARETRRCIAELREVCATVADEPEEAMAISVVVPADARTC